MNEGAEVIAILAPAFVGQFGPKATPNKIKAALLDIGLQMCGKLQLEQMQGP